MTDLRCAPASRERCESGVATASTVRAFLVLQQEGSWGRDALQDSALPADVAAWLRRMARETGVRPLLVRRHARAVDDSVTVMAAFADPRDPWLETERFADVSEVMDLDLAALATGTSVGLARDQRPAFLTCTHGSHDACCAVEGRPVASALAASHPELAWECSHIGGDRFAGNLLVLPHGLYYGRVDATSAPSIADAHLSGRLDMAHLRGRSGHSFAIQAAEHHVRTHLGLDGIDDLVLVGRRRDGDDVTARFRIADRTWDVTVRPRLGDVATLTCRAPRASRPRHHELVDIRPA
ncbi:MAG TPA: sucrase ferredoxin [Nitriliruptoraceae bacterium]|nr:sucrase ferredoxin [Nitriliruptoraceae bacterium]